MQYNKQKEIKEEKELYKEQLDDEVAQLRYLVNAPLDDAFKIRIAREKLGMCFPDEIVFHTDFE
jgi:cell division protein FtsB